MSDTLAKLRELKASCFIRVADLATALNVTAPTVYAWLAGRKAIRSSNQAAIERLWEDMKVRNRGTSAQEKWALKRGLFTLRVFEGHPREAIVVCEHCSNPPHNSLVVCGGILGRWSVAINTDLNLVTSVADGSILHIDGPPDHVVLGRLVSYNGEAVAA